jgi:hypothetical protein
LAASSGVVALTSSFSFTSSAIPISSTKREAINVLELENQAGNVAALLLN